MMVQFEKLFEKTARGDVRLKAMEVADRVAKGLEKPVKLRGRLSRFSSVRIDSQRFLLLSAKPSLIRVLGVCIRESIKFEVLYERG